MSYYTEIENKTNELKQNLEQSLTNPNILNLDLTNFNLNLQKLDQHNYKEFLNIIKTKIMKSPNNIQIQNRLTPKVDNLQKWFIILEKWNAKYGEKFVEFNEYITVQILLIGMIQELNIYKISNNLQDLDIENYNDFLNKLESTIKQNKNSNHLLNKIKLLRTKIKILEDVNKKKSDYGDTYTSFQNNIIKLKNDLKMYIQSNSSINSSINQLLKTLSNMNNDNYEEILNIFQSKVTKPIILKKITELRRNYEKIYKMEEWKKKYGDSYSFDIQEYKYDPNQNEIYEEEKEPTLFENVYDYFKELSKFKDIQLMMQGITEMTNYVGIILNNITRKGSLKSEIIVFLQTYFHNLDDFKYEINGNPNTFKIIKRNFKMTDNHEVYFQELKPKIIELIDKYFPDLNINQNTNQSNFIQKLDFQIFSDELNKEMLKWFQSKKYNIQEPIIDIDQKEKITKKIIDFFLNYTIKYILKDINILYDYKNFIQKFFKSLQNNLFYRYNVPSIYDSTVKLIISKLSLSDPDELEHLYFRLNRLNQQFHFLNIDLLLNDLDQNPISTRMKEWKLKNKPIYTIKQDIYKNKNRLYSNDKFNLPDRYHDRVYISRNKTQRDGPKLVESMLQTIVNEPTETLKKYITGEMKFSNEPKFNI